MTSSAPAQVGSGEPQSGYAIRLVVSDDLQRSRATVFFRLLLAVPHLVWMWLWWLLAVPLWFVDWVWTVIAGRSPSWAHAFYTAFIRYNLQANSYIHLAAERYPGFLGEPGHPVDLVIDGPTEQRRLVTLFRPVLAIPMLVVSSVLQYVQMAVAVIAWFFCLVTGRMHEGMRNVITFCLAFTARTNGYLVLLDDRYPPFSEQRFPTS